MRFIHIQTRKNFCFELCFESANFPTNAYVFLMKTMFVYMIELGLPYSVKKAIQTSSLKVHIDPNIEHKIHTWMDWQIDRWLETCLRVRKCGSHASTFSFQTAQTYFYACKTHFCFHFSIPFNNSLPPPPLLPSPPHRLSIYSIHPLLPSPWIVQPPPPPSGINGA